MRLDIIFDILGLTGIGMLAYGLYQISPIHMYVIIGAMFIVFALMASRGNLQILRKKTKG